MIEQRRRKCRNIIAEKILQMAQGPFAFRQVRRDGWRVGASPLDDVRPSDTSGDQDGITAGFFGIWLRSLWFQGVDQASGR